MENLSDYQDQTATAKKTKLPITHNEKTAAHFSSVQRDVSWTYQHAKQARTLSFMCIMEELWNPSQIA